VYPAVVVIIILPMYWYLDGKYYYYYSGVRRKADERISLTIELFNVCITFSLDISIDLII
jgi:hypothetical protein